MTRDEGSQAMSLCSAIPEDKAHILTVREVGIIPVTSSRWLHFQPRKAKFKLAFCVSCFLTEVKTQGNGSPAAAQDRARHR